MVLQGWTEKRMIELEGDISKKVQERRLKWYGYVKRTDEEYVGKE